MGCYINPPNETKEEWLKEHAVEVSGPTKVLRNRVPVCLIDNWGMFTAAAVGFSEEETEYLAKTGDDNRSKKWFTAPREKAHEVSPLKQYEDMFPPSEFPEEEE